MVTTLNPLKITFKKRDKLDKKVSCRYKRTKSKDIKMVPTNLVGRSKASGYEKFEIDKKRRIVKRCPPSYNPINSPFKDKSCRKCFNKKHCSNCPLRKDCSVA